MVDRIDRRFADPVLGPIIRQIIDERYAEFYELQKTAPQVPTLAFSVAVRDGYRVMRGAFELTSLLSLISTLWCFAHPTGATPYIGSLAVASGIAVWIALLAEIAAGAGNEVENVHKTDLTWVVSRYFEPFVNTLRHVLIILFIGLVAVVTGFAAVFWHLSASLDGFSKPLTPISATYLSLVTFATVGFGDITPVSELSRVVVSIEIVISLFAFAAAFAVAVSWAVATQQRRYEAFMNGLETQRTWNEQLQRKLRIGPHIDLDEIATEALGRIGRHTTA